MQDQASNVVVGRRVGGRSVQNQTTKEAAATDPAVAALAAALATAAALARGLDANAMIRVMKRARL